tara:strand:+ start:9825 stop:10511 length:687 start_codon:yes stop_codon:yes gene_type:complete
LAFELLFIKLIKILKNKLNYIISPEIVSYNNFTPKLKIAILASGEGSNFQVLIDLAKKEELDIDIKILICNKKNAGCIKRANYEKIPYFICEESNCKNKDDFEKKIIDKLIENEVELIVMAGWMKVVTEKFITSFNRKIINIHPSLLPSFKGKSPIKDALENGVFITGCSVHYVVPEVDSGELIIQGAIQINKHESIDTLTRNIHHIEHLILPLAISEAGSIIRRYQG